jgi:hypothetical protein
MPQPCSICTSPARHAIDVAIVAGTPNRRVAALFDVSEQAVRRHRVGHLPAQMARARDAAKLADTDDLVAQARALQARALAILDAADAAGNHRTALSAIREGRGALQLVAQLTGKLRERVEVDVEPRRYIADWGTLDGTLNAAAHEQTDVAARAPAPPLAHSNGTNAKPSP